jgi:hypothetical protein
MKRDPRQMRHLYNSCGARDQLLAQDVGVSAVLGEFTQHVQVHPTQRERTAPVAMDEVVQTQPRRRAPGGLARCAVCSLDRGDGVLVVQDEGLVGRCGDADLGAGPARDRLVEPDLLDKDRVLDQAEQRRPRCHQRPPHLLLGQPVQAGVERRAMLIEKRLQLNPDRLVDDRLGSYPGQPDMRGILPPHQPTELEPPTYPSPNQAYVQAANWLCPLGRWKGIWLDWYMPGLWAEGSAWYTSATLWAVLGVAVALAGSIGTWLTLAFMNPRRGLRIGVRTDAPLMTAPDELRDDLRVVYREVKLTEPRVVEVQLVGRGRRDIPESLFEGHPMRLHIGPQIVRVAAVASSESSRPRPEVVPDGTSLLIQPTVIGKRQQIIISLLVDGPKPELNCEAPFADVSVRPLTSGDFSPSKARQTARIATLVLVGLMVGLILPLLTPQGRSATFGVNHPIELRPLCEGLGGIIAPPAERDAAFHYRCKSSTDTITQAQIEQRCHDQWGTRARLVLRDRDSAAGWTCHTPGWLGR